MAARIYACHVVELGCPALEPFTRPLKFGSGMFAISGRKDFSGRVQPHDQLIMISKALVPSRSERIPSRIVLGETIKRAAVRHKYRTPSLAQRTAFSRRSIPPRT
jgi:hypothetical protein